MSYSPIWSGWQGSHLRPLAPQASALLLRHSLMPIPPPGVAPGFAASGAAALLGRSALRPYATAIRWSGIGALLPAPSVWKTDALLNELIPELVGVAGFAPAASSLATRRSGWLS